MAFLIKNLFLKAKKLILNLEKISTQDFNILQCNSAVVFYFTNTSSLSGSSESAEISVEVVYMLN